MNKLYCYKCRWVGTFNQLGILEVKALGDNGNEINKYWCCPECGSLEGITEYSEGSC